MYNLLLLLVAVPFVLSTKKECPGGTFKCPDFATCCQLLDKSYGCCPLKDAICCDDHLHCCPSNTKCSAGMCVQPNEHYLNTSRKAVVLGGNNVICPDSQSICPSDTTCCKNSDSGSYSCCPFQDAVCCSDGDHCCPTGTVCNLEEQRCDGDRFVAQMYDSRKKLESFHQNKFSPLKVNDESFSNVICPGSEFQCPNGYTCCKIPDGDWGCCPFPDATCCKDGQHCCPQYMTCDATSQYCSQGLRNITSRRQIRSKKIIEKNICPDKKSSCEDSQTCCRMQSGFGCCLYQNATCCSDLQHCCPQNEECDVQSSRCVPRKNFKYSVNNI